MTNLNDMLNELNLILDENDEPVTTLANASAIINEHLTAINWVGFYLYKNNSLYLGPFQGLRACTRISLENGVCGKCAREAKTIVVDNVHEFPGHIACDDRSNSEVCIPLIISSRLYGLLDIDSNQFSRFDHHLVEILEEASKIIQNKLKI